MSFGEGFERGTANLLGILARRAEKRQEHENALEILRMQQQDAFERSRIQQQDAFERSRIQQQDAQQRRVSTFNTLADLVNQYGRDSEQAAPALPPQLPPQAPALPPYRVTSQFGKMRTAVTGPNAGKPEYMSGTDLALAPGQPIPVIAPRNLTVLDVMAGTQRYKGANTGVKSKGDYVKAQDEQGNILDIMHLNLKPGEIKKGQKIPAGTVFNTVNELTGSGTAPHIRVNARDAQGNLFDAAPLFREAIAPSSPQAQAQSVQLLTREGFSQNVLRKMQVAYAAGADEKELAKIAQLAVDDIEFYKAQKAQLDTQAAVLGLSKDQYDIALKEQTYNNKQREEAYFPLELQKKMADIESVQASIANKQKQGVLINSRVQTDAARREAISTNTSEPTTGKRSNRLTPPPSRLGAVSQDLTKSLTEALNSFKR